MLFTCSINAEEQATNTRPSARTLSLSAGYLGCLCTGGMAEVNSFQNSDFRLEGQI